VKTTSRHIHAHYAHIAATEYQPSTDRHVTQSPPVYVALNDVIARNPAFAREGRPFLRYGDE